LANKQKFYREEALDLAKECKTVIVSKGKKSLRFEWADGATDDDVAAVILGRSGTLRAPAMRVGDAFVVGFHQEEYQTLFG